MADKPTVETILDAWFADDAPEDRNALIAALQSDAELRRAVAEELWTFGKLQAVQTDEPKWLKLQDLLGSEEDEELESRIFEALECEEPLRKKRPWLLPTLSAVAAGLVVAFVSWLARPKAPDDAQQVEIVEVEPAPSVLSVGDELGRPAVVSEAVGAVRPDGSLIEKGARLEMDSLTLAEGLLQLDFYCGARILLEGPAKIEFDSHRSIILHEGRISCQVSEMGRGFRVRAHDAEVVDLGTSFSMQAGATMATQVHVNTGKVTMRPHDTGVLKELIAGMAVEVGAAALPAIEYAPSRFPSRTDLITREKAAAVARISAWREYGDALRQDPSVITHYTMDGLSVDEPEVPNLVVQDRPQRGTNAAVISAALTDGRWPGKQAVDFRTSNDRLFMIQPGQFDALTIIMWVNVQNAPQPRAALLMGVEPGRWSLHHGLNGKEIKAAEARRSGMQHRLLRWMLHDTGKSSLQMGYIAETAPKSFLWNNYYAKSAVPPQEWQQWHCLAMTYDRQAGVMEHFGNGKSVGRHELMRAEALMLDYVEIGNFSTVDDEEAAGVQFRFYGKIGEVLIASRAFGAEEINAFYEIGKP